jgi:hypothetical protein
MKPFLNIIDGLLDNRIDFDQFYSEFNELYSQQAVSDLPEHEFSFIDGINEKLCFGATNPSAEERRQHNYIDDHEFREWLRKHKSENIGLWN